MKITGDSTCPGCKKDHPVELDIDNLDIKAFEIPKVNNVRIENQLTTPPTGQQTTQVIEKVKEVTKIPSYIPKYKCKNCKENHKNKDYTQKPKFKCSNCGQFSLNSDSCIWCDGKEFDELEEDELKELGIEEPDEEEHEHEHGD